MIYSGNIVITHNDVNKRKTQRGTNSFDGTTWYKLKCNKSYSKENYRTL